MAKKLKYVDLFCGSGGFSLGFDNKGFQNIFSIDIEPSFCETYKYNFPNHQLVVKDICKLSDKDVLALIGSHKIDVVIGGPPCQGFSMAGNIGRKFIDDPRNKLYREFLRVVKVIGPKFFVMENVARLYTHSKGLIRNQIISDFNEIGYNLECKVVNTVHYGIPQIRNRVLFIGSKSNTEILFPKKVEKKPLTVAESIECYPPLKSGEDSDVPNHSAMNHSEQMLKKMSFVKDGGDRNQIPAKIRPTSGDIRKYIRYNSKEPSVCITGDMRKIFHYEQNRALTVRELAKLQTYPDTFIFKGSKISQQQQVGNSVPPKLAESIAEAIKKMVKNV
jgi:DNA (cytosine-5)-methyltransferase 1